MSVRGVALAALALLAGCGGGGGGGGEPDEPPLVFGASKAEVIFDAQRGGATPFNDEVQLSINNRVFSVAYSAGEGELPAWLSLEGQFTSNAVRVVFGVNTTDLPEGDYATTVTFYALDSDQNYMAETSVLVVYRVRELVRWGHNTPTFQHAVFGHSTTQFAKATGVVAAGESWRATTDASWIQVTDDVHEGSGDLQYTFDAAGLAVGTYQADIRIASVDDPDDFDEIPTTFYVDRPEFTLPSAIVGGANGQDESALPFEFSLNTGTNTYPWSAVVKFDLDGWVLIDRTDGSVGAAGDTVMLDADRAGLARGTYLATLEFAAQVLGVEFKNLVTVRLNYEFNKVYAADNGIALYQFPSRSRLVAQTQVINSRGRTDIPWTATSDAPWLAVTASGSTGEMLELVATPDALAAGTVHVAQVTIAADDPWVENDEVVTVSFYKDDEDPAELTVSAPVENIAVNPALPYVHVIANGALDTYNIYDGALVSSMDLPSETYDGLSVSFDGRILYAPTEGLFGLSTVVDVPSWAVQQVEPSFQNALVESARIDGHQFQYSAPGLHGRQVLTLLRDGRRGYGASNYDGNGAFFFGPIVDIAYTALNGPHIRDNNPYQITGTGYARDLAAVTDRERVLIAMAEPNELRLYDSVAKTLLWALPLPAASNNALVRDDGLLVAGAALADESPDVWLYDLDGNLLQQFASPAGTLLEKRLALTSDPQRLLIPTAEGFSVRELPAQGPAIEPAP